MNTAAITTDNTPRYDALGNEIPTCVCCGKRIGRVHLYCNSCSDLMF